MYAVKTDSQNEIARLAINPEVIEYGKSYINTTLGRNPQAPIYKKDWIFFTEQIPSAELALIAPLFSSYEINEWDIPQIKMTVSQLKSEHYFVELASYYSQIFKETGVPAFYLQRRENVSI